MTRFLTSATVLALLCVPASAAPMKCTSENMAKTTAMMQTMPDGPNKMAMAKQIGMANMEMSKGNMKGACKYYMDAQKMGMTKPSGGMKM
jgi:hypothetical protein